MDAVEFIRERNRMCDQYWQVDGDCDGCPIIDADVECNELRNMIDCADKAVKVIEQWAREHPRKTRQSELLKMLPDIPIDENGVARLCPALISKEYMDEKTGGCGKINFVCYKCRRDFWMQEVE